jgi:multidrug efflux system membrane fusion protein
LRRGNQITLSKHIFSVATFTFGVCVTGCDIQSGPTRSVPVSTVVAPLAVNVSVVERIETTMETVVLYGTLVPVRESRLSFQRGGRIEQIHKVTGDRVAEGDVIASLELQEVNSQRQQLLTSLEQSKQRLGSANRETAPPIQQQIAQLEEQLGDVETERQRRVIVAPFAGLVSEIKIQLGETATPSAAVVVIVAAEPPQIEASLAEQMASRVLSQKAIWANIGDRAVGLNVKSSSEIRGPTPGRKIVLSIQEELPNNSWTSGDVVELRFFETIDASGCWLPLGALQKATDADWYVFAIVPTADASDTQTFIVERQPVKIRLLQNNLAFVESSLNSGAFVITDGTHRIVVGQSVIPVTRDGQQIRSSEPGAAN